MGATDLEEYLRSAEILHTATAPVKGGGGHPDKRLVVLDGNLATLAKLGTTGDQPLMSRCEAAAWVLATELTWGDLVPVTVMREVPLDSGTVEASVQVFLPAFETAIELGATVATCPDEDCWRAAMFDVVARQTDRSDGNWGLIKGVARPKLTDNGYAMAPWEQRSFQSVFLEHHKGKSIPEVFLSPVEQFLERAEAGHSRLGEVLDDDALDALLRRARALVNARQLASS